MLIDQFLSGLDGLRGGPDKWVARCPAHEDRTPSLSIRLCGDGRILIHCFAGCSPEGVVSARGMELCDLMPPRPRDGPGGSGPVGRIPDPLRREVLMLALFVERVQRAEDFLLEDIDRACLAASRLLGWLPIATKRGVK